MNNEQKHSENHLTTKQMKDYLTGNIPDFEMHRIEKHILECEFCAEAMEGLEAIPDASSFEQDISKLKKRIEKRTQQPKKQPVFLYKRVLRMAAMVAVLVVASVLITNYFKSDLVQKEFSEKKKTEIPKDKKTENKEAEKQSELNADTTLKSAGENTSKGSQESTKSESAKEESKIEEEINLVDNDKQAKSFESVTEDKMIATDEDVVSEEGIVSADAVVAEEDLISVEIIEDEEELVMGMEADGEVMPASTKERSMYTAAGAVTQVAQVPSTSQLTGTIIDKYGTPIPFVSVLVQNTEIGTTSDIDGKFIMIIPEGNQTLLVTSIGFETQEIDVAMQDTLAIVLLSNDLVMDEIVVGTAKQKKSKSETDIVKPQSVDSKAYEQYLKDSLRYPEEALEAKIKGTVMLQFIVGVNGEISEIEVIKSLGFGCDEEAIRLLLEGSEWLPGSKKGIPTEMEADLKVKFK